MRRSLKSTQSIITGTVLAGSLVFALSATAAPDNDRFPISLADIEAKSAEHFATIDTDDSSDVDLAEFEAAKMPRRGHHMGKRGKRHQSSEDTDHEPRNGHRPGIHDPEARQAMRTAIEAELFAIMDSDDNGMLSKAEFADSNRHDARRTAHKRAMFKFLDANQDQRLSADEMPNPANRLRAADSDADGTISREEMRAQRQGNHERSRKAHAAG